MATDIGYEKVTQGDGRTLIRIFCEETLGTTTSEWNTGATASRGRIPIPRSGKIYIQSELITTGGFSTGATTIQPKFGKVSGWSANTIDDIDQVAEPLAYHKEGVPLEYSFRPASESGNYALQDEILYIRHTPDASPSANVKVRTILTIVEM